MSDFVATLLWLIFNWYKNTSHNIFFHEVIHRIPQYQTLGPMMRPQQRRSFSDNGAGGSVYLISSSSSFATMQRPIATTSDMKAARRLRRFFSLFVDRWARCFCLVHIVQKKKQKNNIFQVSHEEVGEMETCSLLTPRFASRTDVCGPPAAPPAPQGALHKQ